MFQVVTFRFQMSLKRKTPKRVYNFNLFYNICLPLKNTQKNKKTVKG